MSNISIRSEKSDSSHSGGSKVMGEVGVPHHKAKLHELFASIDKEFDALYEENLELRARLAALSGGTTAPPKELRKHPSSESLGTKILSSSESIGAKSLKLRFVKLQKNKVPKPKSGGCKYLMLKDFKEHRDGLWEVSACPWDVSYFATASADHTARVWSADGSRASIVYLAHMGSVNSIRFHPADRLVCTASGDKNCHIWKLPQPSQMKPTTSTIDVRTSKDSVLKPRPKPWTPILGDRGDDFVDAATPGSSPTLSSMQAFTDHREISSTGTGRPTSGQMPPFNPNTTNPISIPTNAAEKAHSQEASPTNELEETANIAESAGSIVVRTPLLELKGHTGPVVAASWVSSNTVATASWDHSVRVWGVDNGRVMANWNSNHDKAHKITNVNTHPTSAIVLFSVTEGTFRIWDFRSAEKPDVVVAHQGPTSTAIFTSDGMSILSGGDDRTVKIWDLRNCKSPKVTIRCHSGVNRLAVSPVTSSIVIPTDDKRSSIYDIHGSRKGKFYHYEKCGHKSMVTSAAWSNDESVIFTAGFDRRVIAWAQ